jgi:small subunit ribosomal protein S1
MPITETDTKDELLTPLAERTPMQAALYKTPLPPVVGDLLEGRVIVKDKNAIYIDAGIFGTGIIYGREFLNARDVIKKTKIGDIITAKVVDAENEGGYIELSLREAKQAAAWREADLAIKEKTKIDLVVKEANRGGLMLEWHGIAGFLPASQLKPEHYPRIDDGDKDKVVGELKKLIGEKITVMVITADQEENKLIFSEKTQAAPERQKAVAKYSVGDVIEGTVTGIVDFGVFVKIEEGLEGLVHISEIDWGLVEHPRDFFIVGKEIKVKIIEIKDDKISLSVKALKENPWAEAKDKYKKDDTVTGVVIKFNKYGALVSVQEGVAGLIHISEFGTADDMHKGLELGKTYEFKITLFDPSEQRMTLVLKGKEEKSA